MAHKNGLPKPKKRHPKAPFPKGNKLGRKFEKGCKPGPGRPRLPPGFRAALEKIEPEALEAIRDIVNDDRHKDREKASEYVLDQRHGKPKQRTELTGLEGGPIAVKTVLTSDERRARAIALAEAVRARLTRANNVD